jgi:hypothetical protein
VDDSQNDDEEEEEDASWIDIVPVKLLQNDPNLAFETTASVGIQMGSPTVQRILVDDEEEEERKENDVSSSYKHHST